MEAAAGGAPMKKRLRKKEGGAREEQVMKKSDLKKETAAGKQQSAMSPETGGLTMLCRSFSAESLKQRLTRTVKEHRARFYIMRRCIQMLICWRDEY
ncbi:hypothetical protein E2562_008451 [Oryza meyeriana var. granulata]|uniref:Uncharacterized protein n=1 Tax=Oryza meyeriana var. granulata TaxID=110450 RepID=A0A6G1EI90_9ORYZ|nr:hypothetical protein E2562_008451 [Oryza meyeriana var. granulata]